VDFYEQVGFLPDAVVNYLLLLGWALDDKTEFFDRKAMLEHFSLERVNRAPAGFDPAKLTAFQARYMQQEPLERRLELCLPYLQRAGLVESPAGNATRATVERVVEAAGDRIVVAGDVLDYADFFTSDADLPYDEKAFKKRLRKPPEAARLLAELRGELACATSFDAAALEELVRRFVETREIKIGQIINAARVAATGKAVGFGLYDILSILGRQRCLARIDRALEIVGRSVD
jgi:glutamyl-tRNA synthetase